MKKLPLADEVATAFLGKDGCLVQHELPAGT